MATSLPRIIAGSTRIGFVGIGIMGSSMAMHILNAGYPLTVFNRTASKCQPLVEKGAHLAESYQQVAESSEVIITMLGYPDDVRQAILGQHGLAKFAHPSTIIIDMTTSDPTLAREVYNACSERAVHSLDAPVSGGDVGARNAALSIMVGGDEDVFHQVEPLLSVMGNKLKYLGPAGNGQNCKLTNQIVICSTMIGVVEGLIYAKRCGLNVEDVLNAISSGAASSWSLNNLGQRIVNNNFLPGFKVEHFVKDLGLALSEARRMKLALPGLALANQLYVSLMAMEGGGELGTQALMLVLERMNHMSR